MIIAAALAYSIQIYTDFYSSMEIAIGSAEIFGIKLKENFLRPYFSTTMPEFWRRWHVTLGTWFKDYVFYPISVSKPIMALSYHSRNKFGSNFSLIVSAIPPIACVWLLTGLWHGAAWQFVAWGCFHGLLIILSTAFASHYQKLLTKLGIKTSAFDYKLFQMAKVFVLCSIGRIFFRASSISTAFDIFKSILSLQMTPSLIDLSALRNIDIYLLILYLPLLLLVSLIQEHIGSVRIEIAKTNLLCRWSIWLFLIFSTLYFGIYGAGTSSEFIYENF